MKRTVLYIFISLFINIGFSQNLVYNGSFEIRDSIYYNWIGNYSSCPFIGDDEDIPMLELAKGWNNIQGKYMNQWYSTFDYYHSCNNYIDSFPAVVIPGLVGVPYNKTFTKYQYARTGEGYTAGGLYSVNSYYSICTGELIQSKLTYKLIKDSLYELTFYVNLANISMYSIKSQGALFTNTAITIDNLYNGLINNSISAQVINQNGYIEDTLNWVEISGVFKAKGGEQYITLGNFDISKGKEKLFNANSTANIAAYAIDDISVYPISAHIDSARCGNDTMICFGNSIKLGKSSIEPEYKSEYSFEWYIKGEDDSLFSYEDHPVVSPTKTTTYIVNVIDFKFDKSTDTITVNVLDCSEPTDLIVYPNPSYSIINFKFNSPIPNNMSIEIYDIAGRIIKKKAFTKNYESKQVQLDLSPFASGMYFYSVIINNERSFNGKIIHFK